MHKASDSRFGPHVYVQVIYVNNSYIRTYVEIKFLLHYLSHGLPHGTVEPMPALIIPINFVIENCVQIIVGVTLIPCKPPRSLQRPLLM